MRKVLLVLFLGLCVGGCGAGGSAPTTPGAGDQPSVTDASRAMAKRIKAWSDRQFRESGHAGTVDVYLPVRITRVTCAEQTGHRTWPFRCTVVPAEHRFPTGDVLVEPDASRPSGYRLRQITGGSDHGIGTLDGEFNSGVSEITIPITGP